MGRPVADPDREHRIDQEIVVDAYNDAERALSWYYHLQAALTEPWHARCFRSRVTSPLRVGERVTVHGLATEDDCLHDMIVLVDWHSRVVGVPLSQLEPVDSLDEEAALALGDWRYWVDRGHRF